MLFTTKDGELHARTLTSGFSMPGDTLVESNWAGEFAFVLRDDNRVQMAWTKRFTDQQGYTMTDIGLSNWGGRRLERHYISPNPAQAIRGKLLGLRYGGQWR